MLFALLLAVFPPWAEAVRFTVDHFPHTSISVQNSFGGIVNNSAILAGDSFNDTAPVVANHSDTTITVNSISPSVLKVDIKSSAKPFVGARFADHATFWGVWEQPYTDAITNNGFNETLRGPDIGGNAMATARAPFFVSSNGYGVYADSVWDASFNFTDGSAFFVYNSSSVTYYIITADGPGDFKSIYNGYARLTDTVNLFATSSYGPTFWTDDSTDTEIWPEGVTNSLEYHENVADILEKNKIHSSSMFIDRPWGTGNMGWGNFDWDPEFFPNPAEFVANMSSRGIDIMAWVSNRANTETLFHKVADENGWLWQGPGIEPGNSLGPAVDLANPTTYSWLKEHMLNVSSVGLKGYKIDRGDENEFPDWAQHQQNALMAKLTYEVMSELHGPCAKDKPCESYTFVRSAIDRSRQHVGLWNGDTGADYDGLTMSVRSAIRAGLIGFPIWGSDTGGYFGSGSLELFGHWMWFSCFSPVYEIKMGGSSDPWGGEYGSELMPILKATTDLHHELIPFIQSYAYRAARDGLPIVRALFLEAPNDTTVYEVDDAYFFGEQFLVYPVLEEEKSFIEVYFPEGNSYVEYLGNFTVHEGGSTINYTTAIDTAPVFVREGSIIPRGDIYRANNHWDENWEPSLTIEVFPSYNVVESTFEYYVESLEQAVDIVMTTSRVNNSVVVQHGPVEVSGSLLVHTKSGKQSAPLKQDGGFIRLNDIDSLFD